MRLAKYGLVLRRVCFEADPRIREDEEDCFSVVATPLPPSVVVATVVVVMVGRAVVVVRVTVEVLVAAVVVWAVLVGWLLSTRGDGSLGNGFDFFLGKKENIDMLISCLITVYYGL